MVFVIRISELPEMKDKNIIYSVLLIFLMTSCIKIDTLPPEPVIEYRNFTVFDTTDILGNDIKGGRLKFYFEDGDGDLGYLPPEAQQSTDSINLFLTLYRMKNGVMSLAPDDDPLKPSGYRIPYMERLGQNKILKGNITVTFMYLFYSKKDTIRYDFYIKDRAGHISNTVSTSDIPLYYNGTYPESQTN